jgi:hypothetical protein
VILPVIFGVLALLACFAGWFMRRVVSGWPRWLLLPAAVLLVVGVGLILAGWGILEDYADYRDWPAVSGTVVHSEVVGKRAARPNVVYEYTVDGVLYRDSSALNPPSFGGRTSRRGVAEEIASQYPDGRAVTIHYQPDKPANSLLRVYAPWSAYGKLGAGGLVFFLSVMTMIAYAGRNSPPKPRAA